VARVAGPGYVDRRATDLRRPAPEVAQVVERFAGRGLEDRPRERALQGERGGRLRVLVDRDVEPHAVLAEPAQLRVGGRPAVTAVAEIVDRAVVDDLAMLVAPRRVDDRARPQPGGVAR